jgi:hypothetical protein
MIDSRFDEELARLVAQCDELQRKAKAVQAHAARVSRHLNELLQRSKALTDALSRRARADSPVTPGQNDSAARSTRP